MKIFYVHHALRNMGNPPSQEDSIKPLGKKDAKLVGKLFSGAKIDIKAIYTSSFFRCKETSRLINQYIQVPIFEEPRFNEFKSVHSAVKGLKDENQVETWQDCQNRIIEGLKDIVNKYEDNDTVICVTSGVNLTAFVALAYGIKPSNDLPFPWVQSCSPIGFEINKDSFAKIEN